MSTLVFDIETVGENWSELDGTTQAVLTRWVDKTSRDAIEREVRIADIKDGLGFSPFTGFVVSIGLYDMERARGVVYYTAGSEGEVEAEHSSEDYTYKIRTEAEMLTEFWDGARHYDTFVTYNGRGFDVPFLIHRSLAHGVVPTVNLMEGRYPSQQRQCRHVDLQDEMTFFGAMTRRPSLHLVCRSYGIASPKEEVGGDDVAGHFCQKKFRDIARYNARDVIATAELYRRWKEYAEAVSNTDMISF